MEEGTRIQILAPIVRGKKGEYIKLLQDMQKEGFVRARIDGENYELSDDIDLDRNKKHNKPILVYKFHWVQLHEEFHIDLIHLL